MACRKMYIISPIMFVPDHKLCAMNPNLSGHKWRPTGLHTPGRAATGSDGGSGRGSGAAAASGRTCGD